MEQNKSNASAVPFGSTGTSPNSSMSFVSSVVVQDRNGSTSKSKIVVVVVVVIFILTLLRLCFRHNEIEFWIKSKSRKPLALWLLRSAIQWCTKRETDTFLTKELYKNGNSTLYSVLIGCLNMILSTELNSVKSSSSGLLILSLKSGSNFGPPGIATFRLLL